MLTLTDAPRYVQTSGMGSEIMGKSLFMDGAIEAWEGEGGAPSPIDWHGESSGVGRADQATRRRRV